ncbi:hypothetical protein QQF64_004559 [Cirrhinus molitorella]|uniref:Uncharacterized protein n=1 Tax=Cirrhinus molitorella TaxID=172907 RepID=A0ABR3MJQ0_9TELE
MAEELSQADSLSNISNAATCEDDRTASWVHSQLPSRKEPNSQVAVPVADDNTMAVRHWCRPLSPESCL